MTGGPQPRQPAGSAGGGRWTGLERPEADLELAPLVSGGGRISPDGIAADADVAELEAAIAPDQPLQVRLAVAASPLPGVADRAAHDPDPFVRALATCGWDLSPANRLALARDVEVGRALEAVSAGPTSPHRSGRT